MKKKTLSRPKTAGRSAPRLADPIAAATEALLDAAAKWVHANGGDLVIVGGIEVQKWPEDRLGQFRVAVGCLGRMPIQGAIPEPKAPGARRAEGSKSPKKVSTTVASDNDRLRMGRRPK